MTRVNRAVGRRASRQRVKQRVMGSRAAPLAVLPHRLGRIGRHNAHTIRQSVRWLVRSREFTNYTYDLTPVNREQLAWFVAGIAGVPVTEVRGYITELMEDEDLRRHVAAATEASARRRIADREVRYGRRLGWYALVRALRPEHVVETGTDKGLGTCVFAAALLRNGGGRVTTVDVNPAAGYLVDGPYARVTDVRIDNSLAVLTDLIDVDMFIHDSDHTPEHEAAELRAIQTRLRPGAVVLSDNAHVTSELALWAEETGRAFSYFGEQPADHWYPGAGIGAATMGAARRSERFLGF